MSEKEKVNPNWCSRKIDFVSEAEKERYVNLVKSIKTGYGIPIGTVVIEALELYTKELKAKSKKPKKKIEWE